MEKQITLILFWKSANKQKYFYNWNYYYSVLCNATFPSEDKYISMSASFSNNNYIDFLLDNSGRY